MSTVTLDNKTILVTGVAGFIGSNLVKRIYQEAPSATVIGIDNMKIMSSTSTVEGLGFSIPSKTVRRVVNALCADGEIGHPVIGITCYAVSVTADEGIGADGLYVATIFSNSDAAIQGLQVGDIITAIDGQPIRQVSDVDLASRHVGDVITATVWRDGETLDITFALSEQNDLN